jgi:DNA-binding response OmpR family regulator
MCQNVKDCQLLVGGTALRIALHEDDRDQAQAMQWWIQAAGHDCRIFPAAKKLIDALKRDTYDLLVLDYGNYRVDLSARHILRDGETVALTHKEYELAMFLFRNAGRLLSRAHILESVRGRSASLKTRTVDTHISRLRNRLDLKAERGWRPVGIYHHGYRLERYDPAESHAG